MGSRWTRSDPLTFTGDKETETRRHAWSDNDLFGQKWTNQDLSVNTFELELSSSCQNLSNEIIPTYEQKIGKNEV